VGDAQLSRFKADPGHRGQLVDSPVLMTCLLAFGTGKRLLERSMANRRGYFRLHAADQRVHSPATARAHREPGLKTNRK
jgi:steroid 5-alpha reductase family enzyme